MSEDKSSALYDDIVTVNSVDPALYDMYPVKRGLRNNDGSGVIAGITNISNVHGYMMNEGDKVPVEGKLTFRGYDIYDLLSDTSPSKRYGLKRSRTCSCSANFLRKTNSTSSWLLSMQSANCPMASRPHVSCAILQRT